MEYITIVYAMLLSVAQTMLGYVLANFFLARLSVGFRNSDVENIQIIPIYWVLGLLTHLSLTLLLRYFQLPWLAAIWLPLLILLIAHRHLKESISLIGKGVRKFTSVSFLLWMSFHIFLGSTLFTLSNGISTSWINNYGDLTFHLGMIHHFAFGVNFIPEYHLYAGEKLSYPFFINLWSTMLWLPSETLSSLRNVFVFQWVALWCCAYSLLARRYSFYLPWVLLFGGGSYLAIISRPDIFSWQLINEGFPWTTWLSTVWVTQRSALMGMVCCIAASSLVLNTLKVKGSAGWRFAVSGLIIGLSPLAHTHFFLVTALFVGFYLMMKGVNELRRLHLSWQNFSWKVCLLSRYGKALSVVVLFSFFALLFFPLLSGKSGMTKYIFGWTVPAEPTGIESIITSLSMWFTNAPHWFAVLACLVFLSKQYVAFAVLGILFILANAVLLASWEWDQLKVFLAIYTLMLVLWSHYVQKARPKIKLALIHSLLALLLVGPGVYEALRIWMLSPMYQVYSPQKITLAELIRKNVPRDAVIASPTDHNSAATLSGRSLFVGYAGTLSSHNINYREREELHFDLHKIRHCKLLVGADSSFCPSYLIWDVSGRKYWHRYNPGEGFTKIASTSDGYYSIYRIEND